MKELEYAKMVLLEKNKWRIFCREEKEIKYVHFIFCYCSFIFSYSLFIVIFDRALIHFFVCILMHVFHHLDIAYFSTFSLVLKPFLCIISTTSFWVENCKIVEDCQTLLYIFFNTVTMSFCFYKRWINQYTKIARALLST